MSAAIGPDVDLESLIPLDVPADGVPEVLTTPAQLAAAVEAMRAGSGPVAVDAERASGFRYGQHNYLVQMRRAGAGTLLIDPIALPDLSALSEALRGVEWVFHAADQDLGPLAEQALVPDRVFDTEVAARVLGMPRVGLAAVVAEVLGFRLAKEHAAADWSTRPLPRDWLIYAALDVEVLVELRDRLVERLEAAGRLEWALQENEHERVAPPKAPRTDPWRRTSRITELRSRRQLAVARELWYSRDTLAQMRDVSPGHVLNDRAIVAAAAASPRSVADLLAVPGFAGRGQRSRITRWFDAIQRAMHLPEDQLPPLRPAPSDTPPHHRTWQRHYPVAHARLDSAKAALGAVAESIGVTADVLLQPSVLRAACWDISVRTEDDVRTYLSGAGARPWQIDLVTAPLAAALTAEVQLA